MALLTSTSTTAQQATAERVLRHAVGSRRGGGFLSADDVRALVALLDRLYRIEAAAREVPGDAPGMTGLRMALDGEG